MRPRKPLKERFWCRVKKTGCCWIWTGYKNQFGYGIILAGEDGIHDMSFNKRFVAHRVSYEIHFGPFDKALYVCHKCDNPSCVRPDHLFLGTQFDNMRDCASKNRVRNQGFKPFSVRSPDGTKIEGTNLTKFCRDNGLRRTSMFEVIRGQRKSHKGYTKN